MSWRWDLVAERRVASFESTQPRRDDHLFEHPLEVLCTRNCSVTKKKKNNKHWPQKQKNTIIVTQAQLTRSFILTLIVPCFSPFKLNIRIFSALNICFISSGVAVVERSMSWGTISLKISRTYQISSINDVNLILVFTPLKLTYSAAIDTKLVVMFIKNVC